ncbi:unnamed protein product [Amoebophrya sp. A120]|nr:unnamed protein product [Amoebophrya sp. A120]|eukprot:GSA120T00007328001.1
MARMKCYPSSTTSCVVVPWTSDYCRRRAGAVAIHPSKKHLRRCNYSSSCGPLLGHHDAGHHTPRRTRTPLLVSMLHLAAAMIWLSLNRQTFWQEHLRAPLSRSNCALDVDPEEELLLAGSCAGASTTFLEKQQQNERSFVLFAAAAEIGSTRRSRDDLFYRSRSSTSSSSSRSRKRTRFSSSSTSVQQLPGRRTGLQGQETATSPSPGREAPFRSLPDAVADEVASFLPSTVDTISGPRESAVGQLGGASRELRKRFFYHQHEKKRRDGTTKKRGKKRRTTAGTKIAASSTSKAAGSGGSCEGETGNNLSTDEDEETIDYYIRQDYYTLERGTSIHRAVPAFLDQLWVKDLSKHFPKLIDYSQAKRRKWKDIQGRMPSNEERAAINELWPQYREQMTKELNAFAQTFVHSVQMDSELVEILWPEKYNLFSSTSSSASCSGTAGKNWSRVQERTAVAVPKSVYPGRKDDKVALQSPDDVVSTPLVTLVPLLKGAREGRPSAASGGGAAKTAPSSSSTTSPGGAGTETTTPATDEDEDDHRNIDLSTLRADLPSCHFCVFSIDEPNGPMRQIIKVVLESKAHARFQVSDAIYQKGRGGRFVSEQPRVTGWVQQSLPAFSLKFRFELEEKGGLKLEGASISVQYRAEPVLVAEAADKKDDDENYFCNDPARRAPPQIIFGKGSCCSGHHAEKTPSSTPVGTCTTVPTSTRPPLDVAGQKTSGRRGLIVQTEDAAQAVRFDGGAEENWEEWNVEELATKLDLHTIASINREGRGTGTTSVVGNKIQKENNFSPAYLYPKPITLEEVNFHRADGVNKAGPGSDESLALVNAAAARSMVLADVFGDRPSFPEEGDDAVLTLVIRRVQKGQAAASTDFQKTGPATSSSTSEARAQAPPGPRDFFQDDLQLYLRTAKVLFSRKQTNDVRPSRRNTIGAEAQDASHWQRVYYSHNQTCGPYGLARYSDIGLHSQGLAEMCPSRAALVSIRRQNVDEWQHDQRQLLQRAGECGEMSLPPCACLNVETCSCKSPDPFQRAALEEIEKKILRRCFNCRDGQGKGDIGCTDNSPHTCAGSRWE